MNGSRVTAQARPRLRRGVRLMNNPAQGGWMLAAPERMFKIDQVAVEVLNRCDGTATLAEVVDDLARLFNAPRSRIEADVTAMLANLADKQLLEL